MKTEPTQPPVQPWDAQNQKLVSNVHPVDWKNPTPTPRYNLVVIGGGTAGQVSAVDAAGLGAKVALIEKHFMGGDCLNVGCVPSKAIIRAARKAAGVRDMAEFGVNVPNGTTIDFAKVMERTQGIEVHTFTQELSKVDRAILDGETEGFVRVHVHQVERRREHV